MYSTPRPSGNRRAFAQLPALRAEGEHSEAPLSASLPKAQRRSVCKVSVWARQRRSIFRRSHQVECGDPHQLDRRGIAPPMEIRGGLITDPPRRTTRRDLAARPGMRKETRPTM